MQNKFKLDKIVSVVVVLLVIVGTWYFVNVRSEKDLPDSLKSEEYISGVITDVDGGCALDAWCLIEIDNKTWVIYNPGLVAKREPIGKIEGPIVIGVKVDAYAKKSEEQGTSYQNLHTIVGDEKYYIKTVKNPIEYKNDELGFSFVSSYGHVYQNKNRIYEDAQNFIDEEFPFILPGEKGQSFRAYIPNEKAAFYFAGMTPNYSAPRDTDCGEVRNLDIYNQAVKTYGEKTNSVGSHYVYQNITESEMEGPHQVAYFKLKKGPFPVLGFCTLEGMSENDFIQVIDTVKIY